LGIDGIPEDQEINAVDKRKFESIWKFSNTSFFIKFYFFTKTPLTSQIL
jgi:hypothetical protein